MSSTPLVLYAHPNLLTPEECNQLIDMIKNSVCETLRTRTRLQFDDVGLADKIRSRLQDSESFGAVFGTVVDEFHGKWTFDNVNPHFRLVEYTHGQCFGRHEDGFCYLSSGSIDYICRTFASVNVYLNDVPVYTGGATHFIDHAVYQQPQQGLASIFKVDNVLHEGMAINGPSTIKYLLRTDLVYKLERRRAYVANKLYRKSDSVAIHRAVSAPNECWLQQCRLLAAWMHASHTQDEQDWNAYQDIYNNFKRFVSSLSKTAVDASDKSLMATS